MLENFHKSHFYIDKKAIFETLKNLFGEMNKFYKSKSLLRLSFLLVALFSVVSIANSCKDDDDDDQFTDHLVRFEAKIVKGTGTDNGAFKAIVTQIGTSQNQLLDPPPPGTLWTSDEFFVNSSQSQINLDAIAQLLYPDSELIVTLYVDGEVAKSDTTVGAGTKSASIDHSFLEL